MTADHKERIYRDYYRFHVLPRKGPLTSKRLISSGKTFDLHFAEFLPKKSDTSILDLGCGSGALVWWLHSRGYANAVGIDLSADQINAGRELQIPNLYDESLEDHMVRCPKQYGLIFLRDVLEHIPPDLLLSFLDLVYSVLAPSGELVLQVPNGSSPFFGRVLYGDFSHERAFTAASLSQVLLISGFEKARFKAFEPRLPVVTWDSLVNRRGWRSVARLMSWLLVKNFYRFLLFAELGESDHIVTYNIIASARKSRKERQTPEKCKSVGECK
jgi:SAM-dependent methyltransferase